MFAAHTISLHTHCKNRRCGTRVKTAPVSRCSFSMQNQLNLMELHLVCNMVRRPFRPWNPSRDRELITSSSGYGSNNVSLVPFFSPLFLAFAHEFGGVVAIPNIRGGSEFGSSWSEAGVKAQKVNAVDDFISATFVSPDQFLYYSWSNTAREYLVTQKCISSKTAILGWSFGAELVSESIARAPSGTFGCAIADKGVQDLLRVNCKSIDLLSSVSHSVFSVFSVFTWGNFDGDHWWPV